MFSLLGCLSMGRAGGFLEPDVVECFLGPPLGLLCQDSFNFVDQNLELMVLL